MNILVIGKFYPEGFAQHISQTLTLMGHFVVEYQPGQSYKIPKGKVSIFFTKLRHVYGSYVENLPFAEKAALKKLEATLGNTKIDLTVVCHDFLTPNAVYLIKKKTNAPIVMWFPDHIAAIKKAMFLVSDYDHLFFKDPYMVDLFRNEYSKNAFYLPECCNPIYHNQFELSESDKKKYACDISTAGGLHAPRLAFFSQLTDLGYDIKIWGSPAPRWIQGHEKVISYFQKEFVVFEDKSKSFAASKIVLNNLYPGEIQGVNVRTFEIAAANAFQLVNYRPRLNELYSEEEIVSFRNVGELLEKINYYLKNEVERRSIAQRAFIRTHQEHTYEKRLSQMINTVSKTTSPL